MVVIALTGGIAVGKTVLMHYWKSKYTLPIFDMDDIGRELLLSDRIKSRIKSHFGSSVFDSQGQIIRASLQRRIFSHDQDKQVLESLLHPEIRRKAQEQIECISNQHPYCLVVVPLLYETNTANLYDRVCVIESVLAQRVRRCLDRGLSEDVALAIIQSQASSKDRLSIADDVLYNVQDHAFFYAQIDDLYQQYQNLFG